ncbi:MAG: RusA family crossover junction endodeoxyribonuclease [Nanoarchaeota archaeon]
MKEKDLQIISIKPISINECWQGRRFMTSKYKDFTKDMLRVMPKRKMLSGNVELKITLYLKSLLRGDIDNFVKPIIDCMVKKGWIEDDRFIQKLEVLKIKNEEESIGIEIN